MESSESPRNARLFVGQFCLVDEEWIHSKPNEVDHVTSSFH